MRTSSWLAITAFMLFLASALFAKSAATDGTFMAGWFAVASIVTGVAAMICGASAIARFSGVLMKADAAAQQIADANLKQITARANVAEAHAMARRAEGGE